MISRLEVNSMSRVFMYPSIIGVLLFLIWSWKNPSLASTVFLIIVYSWLALLMFYDRFAKPDINPTEWTSDEIDTIRKHHIFLKTPIMARIYNANLNILRLSAFLWIPWLLWNRLFIPAALIGIFYFIPYSLSKRLDPLNRPVNENTQYRTEVMQRFADDDSYEAMRLAYIIEKLRAKRIDASKNI